jgi:hypothetical protein
VAISYILGVAVMLAQASAMLVLPSDLTSALALANAFANITATPSMYEMATHGLAQRHLPKGSERL